MEPAHCSLRTECLSQVTTSERWEYTLYWIYFRKEQSLFCLLRSVTRTCLACVITWIDSTLVPLASAGYQGRCFSCKVFVYGGVLGSLGSCVLPRRSLVSLGWCPVCLLQTPAMAHNKQAGMSDVCVSAAGGWGNWRQVSTAGVGPGRA